LFYPNPLKLTIKQRRQIEEAAAADGDLAVRHVDVLLDLIYSEYANRISLIEKMFPK